MSQAKYKTHIGCGLISADSLGGTREQKVVEFNFSNLEAYVGRGGFEGTGGAPSASIEDHNF